MLAMLLDIPLVFLVHPIRSQRFWNDIVFPSESEIVKLMTQTEKKNEVEVKTIDWLQCVRPLHALESRHEVIGVQWMRVRRNSNGRTEREFDCFFWEHISRARLCLSSNSRHLIERLQSNVRPNAVRDAVARITMRLVFFFFKNIFLFFFNSEWITHRRWHLTRASNYVAHESIDLMKYSLLFSGSGIW